MSQQQIGALALAALGLLAAAGVGIGAIRGQNLLMGYSLPSRLLSSIAALGLACGVVMHGAYAYGAPLLHSNAVEQIAAYSLAVAIFSYTPLIGLALVRQLRGR